jgi:hypothetical protein
MSSPWPLPVSVFLLPGCHEVSSLQHTLQTTDFVGSVVKPLVFSPKTLMMLCKHLEKEIDAIKSI